MIVGGQTEARAQLSLTIIDYHAPFDQGLTSNDAIESCHWALTDVSSVRTAKERPADLLSKWFSII